MNPRRIHDLMRQRFPPFSAANREWKNIVSTSIPNEALLQEVLDAHIGEAEMLIEVHRRLSALLPASEAAAFVYSHIGEGEIRITNREFTLFVVVAQNGVATGWHA